MLDLQLVLLGRLLLLLGLLDGLGIGHLTVGIEELDEIIESPVQVEVDDLVVLLAEVFDCGEGRDLDALQLVGSGVHLGNDNILIVLVLLSQLVVDGGQLLAVSAPWGVELNQHALALVQGNALEVAGYQHLDGVLVPILGQLLGKEVLLQLAVQELLKERLDGLGGQIVRFGLVLGHVLFQLDQTDGGHLLLVHAEELEDAGMVLLVGRDGHEQDVVAVLLGDLLQGIDVLLDVAALPGHEEQQMRLDRATEDLGSRFVVEVNDQGQRLHLGELLQVFLVQLTLEHGLLVVEGLEQNHSIVLSLVLGNHIGIAAHTKDERVQGVGDFGEGLGLLRFQVLEESNDGDLVVLKELLGISDAGQILGWWAGLLGHPGNDVSGLAATAVLHWRAAAEELQSGVATDGVLLGQLTLDGGIDLGQLDGRLLLGQLLGSLGVLGSQSFAVSAPWGVCKDSEKKLQLANERLLIKLGRAYKLVCN